MSTEDSEWDAREKQGAFVNINNDVQERNKMNPKAFKAMRSGIVEAIMHYNGLTNFEYSFLKSILKASNLSFLSIGSFIDLSLKISPL